MMNRTMGLGVDCASHIWCVVCIGTLWAVAAALITISVMGCRNNGQAEKGQHTSGAATGSDGETNAHAQAVDWNRQGSAAKSYSFVIDDVSYDPDHKVMGRFGFSHHCTKPLRLFGFGFSQPHQLQVRFETFRREESGQWSDVPVGY